MIIINKYAYIRVSSAEQNTDRQYDSVSELNIPTSNIYIDKLPGGDFARPSYRALMRRLVKNDILYIKSIDRLGRNYAEIQNEWRILTKEMGVYIVVIDMPLLDTGRGKDLMGTFLADTVLAVLSFVAENERDNIKKRQAEGIKSVKARGVKFGRPAKKAPDNFIDSVKLWENGKITFDEILRITGLKQATFYNRLWELRIKNGKKKV